MIISWRLALLLRIFFLGVYGNYFFFRFPFQSVEQRIPAKDAGKRAIFKLNEKTIRVSSIYKAWNIFDRFFNDQHGKLFWMMEFGNARCC